MIQALRALFEALAAWFNYRRETDLEDRIAALHNHQHRLTREIDALRSDGSPDATQRADFLRLEHERGNRRLVDLLARYSPPTTREPDSDGRRDLYPPD